MPAMTQPLTLQDQIDSILELMRQKLGVRASDLPTALQKAHNKLPRQVRRSGAVLAQAAPLVSHPKLSRTLDAKALKQASDLMIGHLNAIDLADRRKGWWLGVLGALAFNLLAFLAMLLVFLVWRGIL
ncbi:MAG: hypothetical protein AB8B51_08810 [Sedimentitalea sp.]